MKKYLFICLFVCLFYICVFAAGTANAVPTVANGSFNDLNGATAPNPTLTHSGANLAQGWSGAVISPDWAAPGFNSMAAPNMTSSPDGGNWMMGYSVLSVFESFGQTIAGFDIGKTYELSFYQAHNSSNLNFTANGAWSVGLFGSSQLSTTLVDQGDNQVWFRETLQFVATSTSSLLQFTVGTTNTGISLDGVSLAAVGAPVPEPATITLLGIGLAGLAGGATRRKWKKKAVDKS